MTMNPPFRIGANLWIWDAPVTIDVIATQIPRLAQAGFDTVELPYEAPGSWDPMQVERLLRDHNLRVTVCVAMPPERDLTTDDPEAVSRTTDYLLAAIDAAARIGSPVIAGPVYSPTGRTGRHSPEERKTLLDRLAENLLPVAHQAQLAGVTIAIEPLNRFETSLFNTTAQLDAFLSQVDHPALGFLLDTFHMNIEERDIPQAIRTAGKRLFHVHACGNDRGAPGAGGIPWHDIMSALREIGYSGNLVIESFTGDNAVIAAAAAIWRPLAPSQDALAREGLRFLRSL